MPRFYSRLDKTFPTELAKIEACTCPSRKGGFLLLSASASREPWLLWARHFSVVPCRSIRSIQVQALVGFLGFSLALPVFPPVSSPRFSSNLFFLSASSASSSRIPFSFSRPCSSLSAGSAALSLSIPLPV